METLVVRYANLKFTSTIDYGVFLFFTNYTMENLEQQQDAKHETQNIKKEVTLSKNEESSFQKYLEQQEQQDKTKEAAKKLVSV